MTLLKGRVRSVSDDCKRCRNFLWKDKVPVRTLTEDERARFKCPSWCYGHLVNPPFHAENALDVEQLFQQYKEGSLTKNGGQVFVRNLLDNVSQATKTPKGLREFLAQPVYKSARRPYVGI